MSVKEITKFIAQIGIGSALLIGGLVIIFLGLKNHWDWPNYIVSGSVAMLTGIIAIGLDTFKEIRVLRIKEQEEKKKTARAKNYEMYKEDLAKQTSQKKSLVSGTKVVRNSTKSKIKKGD